MSEDIYFYNKTKKEYIRGYGNGNRSDSLRANFPVLLTWLLMNDWIYDQIYCIGFKQMDYILSATDKTNYYINKFNLSHCIKEHGKLVNNKYSNKRGKK